MLLRFAKSDRHLMEMTTVEITAVEIANLILYDKLDGCMCYNKQLAEGVATVLNGMDFQIHQETDETEQLYRVWIERS